MKNKKNDDRKSVNRITRIINTFSVVWLIVLLVIVFVLRVKSGIPSLLLYACMGVAYIGGFYVFQRILEKSSLKDELEEANRICEEEEEKKTAADEKPEFSSLALIAIFAFVYAIFDMIEMIKMITSDGIPVRECLPQCVNTLTLLICCIFIAVILFNVSRKRIFDRRNSICIYGVGATVIFGTILRIRLMGDAPMPDSDATIYYSLLGIFIIFFGRLFDIAVNIKKEQDLTI